jgi:putative hydrolase of the HAD superfamily
LRVPEPFDAVLLDLYDTIVWSQWFAMREQFAARIGGGIDGPLLQKAFESTRPARGVGAHPGVEGDIAAVLIAAGVHPEPDLVRDLVELERAHLATDVRLYDDVVPVLAKLRERGVKTALVSNCSHSTRPIVERLELEQLFDDVILSFEVRFMKPNAAIYQIALQRLGGVDPSRAVFVDDQPGYCDGATAIGLATRLILRPNEDAPTDTHGHTVVTDLRSLG